MNTFLKFYLLLLLGSCLSNYSKAQILGYGDGLEPPLTLFTGTQYTDDQRAKVINFILTSANTATITLDNLSGLPFVVGRKLLIIQMKGNGLGTHQAVTITGGSYPTYDVESDFALGQSMFTYNTSAPDDRVQVIFLKQHSFANITGGQLTCHPWDDARGTGGILAFMVRGTLTINKGIITVRGKGYTADEAGIVWGTGTTGGAASTTSGTQNAILPAPSRACIDGVGSNVAITNPGLTGGAAGTMANPPSATTGTPVNYGGSFINTTLVMGDPGYFPSGSSGAQGGQGGGWGGDGAAAPACGNAGNPGNQGFNGFNGADAGKGGNGGGAIVIKANRVSVVSNAVVFNASGDDGMPGGNGGFGGLGGGGGKGGAGCCANGTPIMDGGPGGKGDIGLGGKGGAGGNGGKAGFIWIATSPSGYSTTALKRRNNFAVRGGKGGKGGLGGWGGYNSTSNGVSLINPCTQKWCSGGGTACATIICDADAAMCRLTMNGKTGTVIGGTANDIEFKSTTGFVIGKYKSKNNGGDGHLEMYSTNACGTQTKTIANCTGDCDSLFLMIANQIKVNEVFDVLMPSIANTTCFGSGFPVNIIFENTDLTKVPLLHYKHLTNKEQATLTDIAGKSGFVGFFSECLSIDPNGLPGEGFDSSNYEVKPTPADPGEPGEPAPPGNEPPDAGGPPPAPDDNGYVDDSGSWLVGVDETTNNNNDDLKITAYPMPAFTELKLDIASINQTQAQITLIDIQGKAVAQWDKTLQQGANTLKFDIAKLAKGMYMLNVQANGKTAQLKVILQ